MSKIHLTVQLKKDDGTNLGTAYAKQQSTFSAAKALIDAEIAADVAEQQQAAAEWNAAYSAFNS
jgi:hypothetical protein